MMMVCPCYWARTMGKAVIWGASGHGLVVADILRLAGDHELGGFLDDDSRRHGTMFDGVPVLGGRDELVRLRSMGIEHVVVGVGASRTRVRLATCVATAGLYLATVVHPRSVIAKTATLGEGTVICALAVISPGATVGDNVIVNTGASVDHECVLEDGVHVGPGAHLAGRVHVGKCAWIGIGATVTDGVRIGAGALIGAGAVAVRDIPAGVVAYGVPARVIRQVSP
jgi:UDP-N-acetylbacillosamine N-acetyltransferase